MLSYYKTAYISYEAKKHQHKAEEQYVPDTADIQVCSMAEKQLQEEEVAKGSIGRVKLLKKYLGGLYKNGTHLTSKLGAGNRFIKLSDKYLLHVDLYDMDNHKGRDYQQHAKECSNLN